MNAPTPLASSPTSVHFDCGALIDALDAQRAARDLTWPALAIDLWDESAELNAELGDHCLCPGALVRIAHRRADMSCQYAVILLRWLGRAPEEFLIGDVVAVAGTALPDAGPGHRLRWELVELHAALNAERQARGLTWAALAAGFGCTANRLTNLRTARLADMDLVMRVTQWLGLPAAGFIHPARW